MPQGGSTITQQLVRGYFLQDQTIRENGDALIRATPAVRILSALLGVPATNKLLRKLEEVRLALWLEEEMRRHYGSKELAKREIFARYSSFLYLGNGRYGFAAGSEYYFEKPLSSYTTEDAAKAALLAGISKSPRDYAPSPGDPRPVRRRNEILALMARNGYIPEALATACQSEALQVAVPSDVPVEAPAAIQNVFDELKKYGEHIFGVEDLFRGRILGPLHGGRAGAGDRERRPREGPRPVREAAPAREGVGPGLGRGAPELRCGDPGRVRWTEGL